MAPSASRLPANLPCYLVFDQEYADRYSFAGSPAGSAIPAWVPRAELETERGKPVAYALVNDLATLLYLVNQGTLILNKSDVDGAISGNLTIGDGLGGVNADLVHLAANEQIKASGWNWVNVSASGLFELAGHVETIEALTLSGGNVMSGGGLRSSAGRASFSRQKSVSAVEPSRTRATASQ